MSDVVISCLQTHNPLTAQEQLIDFDNDSLNTFHGFRVTQELVNHMQKKVLDSRIHRYKFPFHSTIWENIFKYLAAKDIFRFVIATPRWCRSCNLNALRNKYVFFALSPYDDRSLSVSNFIEILKALPANAKVKTITVESVEQQHPSPRVTAYEGLQLTEIILLSEKGVSVTSYDKILTSSVTFKAALGERQGWLARLQRLDMSSANLKLTDVRGILNLCVQLSDFKIGFKDAGVYPLSPMVSLDNHPNLERLDLSDSEMSSKDLQSLLEKTFNLRVLILKNFKMVDEGTMQFVPEALRHLQKMILQRANFTGKNIHTLLMAGPHVNEVDLSCQTFEEDHYEGAQVKSRFQYNTRLHDSLSGLPEQSLLSLRMVHVSSFFFAADETILSPKIIMNTPLFFTSKWRENFVSQRSLTLKDLRTFLKAAPNLHPNVQALFEDQIAVQQEVFDRFKTDKWKLTRPKRIEVPYIARTPDKSDCRQELIDKLFPEKRSKPSPSPAPSINKHSIRDRQELIEKFLQEKVTNQELE
jgi:uncharacterized protein YjbI with pentapeptide repeats